MEFIKTALFIILGLHVPLGMFTWIGVAWDIDNFFMFWLCWFAPVTVPVGVYMFYFGPPDWILYLFG